MNIQFQPNTLYYGDCLDIMCDFPEECVDLICLDPPFNSKQQYHAIFKGTGLSIEPQIKAFDDMWIWDSESAQRVQDLKNAVANPASKVIAAFEMIIPNSEMLSYTSYMAQRLFEMHRILKDTGSIYLHCDPTASHYLKLIMDAIFGEKNFRNEIIWHHPKIGIAKKKFTSNTDTIFYYTKSDNYMFIPQRSDEPNELATRWKNKLTNNKLYYREAKNINDSPAQSKIRVLEQSLGRDLRDEDVVVDFNLDENKKVIDNIWKYSFLKGNSKEHLGYPTQKPLALYERIIKASSNPGDLVLDPFAGCGTTIEAALINERNVIGIDILPFALRLINQYRVRSSKDLPVQGIPVDFETAKQLAAAAPLKFQDWAISLIDGLAANPKKVGDEGIDGYGMFLSKPDNIERKAIIVQVTGAGGSQKAKFDKLQSDVRSHNAAMGILTTRDTQTACRKWTVNLPPIEMGETTYAPMQCFSIEEYYKNGENYKPLLNLPPLANPWTGKPMDTQIRLDLGEQE